MIGNEVSRVALSVLFALTGAWYLAVLVRLRLRGAGGYAESVGAALHVLLSAAVIVMSWPWGERFPAIAQVTIFTAAAAWFAGRALFGGGALPARCVSWYHAAMMAVVAWIAVLMSAPAVTVAAVPSMAGGGSMPAAMAGMAMDGQAPAVPGTGITAGPGTATAMAVGWAGPVCLVLAAGFFAVAAWYAVAALQLLAKPGPRRRPGTLPRDTASALMAIGLAVALLEMA